MIPTASPRLIFMLQPRRMSLDPNDFHTSRSSISTSESFSGAETWAARPGSAGRRDASALCFAYAQGFQCLNTSPVPSQQYLVLSGVSDTPAPGWPHRLSILQQPELHTLPSATRAAHDTLPRLASARQQGLSAASGVSRPAVQGALLGPLQQGCAGGRHSPRTCLSQPLPNALRMCADKAPGSRLS